VKLRFYSLWQLETFLAAALCLTSSCINVMHYQVPRHAWA
jgi:hypothetical protein